MANLGDVVGGIIGQIAKGRSQADAATIEIAKAYKSEPLLEEFPIPRFSLDEVIIDLKMAIASTPTPPNYITAEARAKILNQTRELIANVPNKEKRLNELIKKAPGWEKVWPQSQAKIMQNISAIIPSNTCADLEALAKGAAFVIRSHINDDVLNKTTQINSRLSKTFLMRDALEIEGRISTQINEIFVQTLKTHALGTNDIEIQVTATQLESIPPEKITTMRFTLKEADRAWTHYETESGETKEKLVPR